MTGPQPVAKVGDRIKVDGKYREVTDTELQSRVWVFHTGAQTWDETMITDVYTAEEHARNSALVQVLASEIDDLLDELFPESLDVWYDGVTNWSEEDDEDYFLTAAAIAALGTFEPVPARPWTEWEFVEVDEDIWRRQVADDGSGEVRWFDLHNIRLWRTTDELASLADSKVREAVIVTLPEGWRAAGYALASSIGEVAIEAARAAERHGGAE